MRRHLSEEYKRRSIVETVHSVIKKWGICKIINDKEFEKEIGLKIIAYNIRRIVIIKNSRLIFIIEVFHRA